MQFTDQTKVFEQLAEVYKSQLVLVDTFVQQIPDGDKKTELLAIKADIHARIAAKDIAGLSGIMAKISAIIVGYGLSNN